MTKSCRSAANIDRLPTSVDRYAQQQYADWFRTFRWSWWVTLTFDREVSSQEANALLKRYLRELEVRSADTLSCLIVEERKHYSGLGKPAGRIHFHLLMAAAADLTAEVLQEYWERMPYGGERTTGPCAHVQAYDHSLSPAYYLFKAMHASADGWELWRPELISPARPASWHTSAKARKSIRRKEARDHKARLRARMGTAVSVSIPSSAHDLVPPCGPAQRPQTQASLPRDRGPHPPDPKDSSGTSIAVKSACSDRIRSVSSPNTAANASAIGSNSLVGMQIRLFPSR